jgi:hypothetical protein
MATKSGRNNRKVALRKKARSTSRKPENSPEPEAIPRSSLYDRTNGFSLGCFLTLIRFKFARPQFHVHRARIAEFLEEEQLGVPLASSQAAYSAVADSTLQDVVLACRTRSRELADFALLGGLATIDATLRLSDEPVINDLRTEAIDVLTRHGLEGERLYARFLAYVRKTADEARESGKTGVQIDTFLTPAMDLLTGALEPLQTDNAMCFVAMPFRPPYGGYFARFYRPLALAMDCRAFRMWGGLSGEAYVDLMLTVMRRCRVVIADLSEVNGNVLYEFGVARGLDKRVVPLCQRRFFKALPSNIASDQLLQVYSPREKEWPDLVAIRCAAQVALIDLSLELAEKALAGARWTADDRLPQLPEYGEDAAGPAENKANARPA